MAWREVLHIGERRRKKPEWEAIEKHPVTDEEWKLWNGPALSLPLMVGDFTLTQFEPCCVQCNKEISDPQKVRGDVVDVLSNVTTLHLVCLCDDCHLFTLGFWRVRSLPDETRIEFVGREGEWVFNRMRIANPLLRWWRSLQKCFAAV